MNDSQEGCDSKTEGSALEGKKKNLRLLEKYASLKGYEVMCQIKDM